jgi:hypothetical protein
LEVGFGRKDAILALPTMKGIEAVCGLSAGRGSLRFNDKDRVATVPREWLLLYC